MKLNMIIDKVKSQPRRKLVLWGILILAILLLVGGAAFYYTRNSTASSSTSAKTKVANYTATAFRDNLRIIATGTGTTTSNQELNFSFSTSGKVAELNVKVGDKVTKGEVLARLGNLESLEASIASDELALLQAQQTLDALKTNAQVNLATALKTYITDQTTYEDALTSQQRTSNARCSEAVNTQDQAKFDDASKRLDAISIRDSGTEAWIEAKNVYDIALANLKYCQGYTQDEKIDAKASLDVAKNNLDQAQKKYNTLKDNNGIDPTELAIAQAKVKAAEAQLKLDQENLAGATITASIDATVITIAGAKDEMADKTTFITLADLNNPAVEVQISQVNQDKLAVGNKIELVLDALPNKTYTGTVTQVNPALVSSGENKVVTGLIKLDSPISDTGNALPLGLVGTVTVVSQEADNVLLVPVDALRDLGNGQYGVFVQGTDQKFRLKTVEVGIKNDELAEIKKRIRGKRHCFNWYY